MESYVVINGKKFRKGYTTGSCAAAAAKAAVYMLFSEFQVENIKIDTPAGILLDLKICDTEKTENGVKCAVIKDGGDDPDVTSGLKIFAEAIKTNTDGVVVKAGEGIGVVTLPGLKVPVGQPAISPVPMKMILKEVNEVLPGGMGVELLFTVPGGAEVAKKTYNPKLGITGGISILGTKGIVEPMSEDAWKDSLALELNVACAKGFKELVYIFGNYGEDFVKNEVGIDAGRIVKISNFVGFMLDKAVLSGVEKLLIVGHAGKLVKVAAGIFHAHSKVADARMEILAAYSALEGASSNTISKIYECKTTEAAASIIDSSNLTGVYSRVVNNVTKRCSEYVFNKISFGTILFGADNKVLAMDDSARELIKIYGEKHE